MITPTDAYDALLSRIADWACQEELGNKAKVLGKAEIERIQRRIIQTMGHAEIFHFTPHQKQDWFMRAKAPIVAAVTGNKWGKTIANLAIGMVASLHCVPWAPREEQEQAYQAYSKIKLEYEPPVTVTIAGPDFVKWLPMNVIPRLKKLIPWDALVVRQNRQQGSVIDGFEFWNGSAWQILSCSGDTERFEGWSTHLMLWDEPMTREKFIAASRGCIEFGAPHVMSFTPENLRDAFVVDEIVLPAAKIESEEDFQTASGSGSRVVLVKGTIWDNPHISEADKETQVSMWNPEERVSREMGELRFFSGRVYKNFSRERHVRELEQMV